MFTGAHIIAGLIVGQLTGNYAFALIGALFPDLDHIYSYTKHKVIFSPKKLWQTITDPADKWGDQRNYFHAFATVIVISAVALSIDFRLGGIFVLGYATHLFLDLIDGSDFYPLFPSKEVKVRGPIKYLSKKAWIITLLMLAVYLALLFS